MNSRARAIMLGTSIPVWNLVFLFAMPETSPWIRALLAGVAAAVYYVFVIATISLPLWRRVPKEPRRSSGSD